MYLCRAFFFQIVVETVPKLRLRVIQFEGCDTDFAFIIATVADCLVLHVTFQPILYLEKDWLADEFAGGCYVGTFPPGVMTSYGRSVTC